MKIMDLPNQFGYAQGMYTGCIIAISEDQSVFQNFFFKLR